MMVAVGSLAATMLVMGIVQRGNLHCLLMNRTTRHARSSVSRMERQHGDQEPKQKCLVKMFHVKDQYSTPVGTTKAGALTGFFDKYKASYGGKVKCRLMHAVETISGNVLDVADKLELV